MVKAVKVAASFAGRYLFSAIVIRCDFWYNILRLNGICDARGKARQDDGALDARGYVFSV